jgi:hypothetical protein
MKAPRYRIKGWSWLGVLNFLLLQWLFVRLEGIVEDGDMRLHFIGPIVPLTGWWSNYVKIVWD